MSARAKRLREIIARRDRVTPVFGIPNAFHAQVMERCGAEVAFIGTQITLGNYTALPDTGVVTMTESLMAARYIAGAVEIPLILDGDTGHGGAAAVQRLVEECIEHGLAGVRLDDQPIETKRATQSSGIEIISRQAAVERYAAAVERRDELDPDFVIMAQCYARDAIGGDLDECLARLDLYGRSGGADWVQFEAPHTVDEIRRAREAIPGMLTVMKGRLPRPLSLAQHRELDLNVAWYTFYPDRVLKARCYEAMVDVMERGIDAWTEFVDDRPGHPYL